ncbi:hypothetical protein RhiirA5_426249 [Rhizophagus irregularis]|uniref:Uncharacterized protein n=1 Tax=Rhizophagus irregularis TaxID=588596 RepID=A0A2N0P4H3_9GLOM|nr:hypothetical protein RhiirA5_426249 [Rhizophagus irregularis]
MEHREYYPDYPLFLWTQGVLEHYFWYQVTADFNFMNFIKFNVSRFTCRQINTPIEHQPEVTLQSRVEIENVGTATFEVSRLLSDESDELDDESNMRNESANNKYFIGNFSRFALRQTKAI